LFEDTKRKGLVWAGFFSLDVQSYMQYCSWNFSVTKLCSKYC